MKMAKQKKKNLLKFDLYLTYCAREQIKVNDRLNI